MLTKERKIELLAPYSADGRSYEGQFQWLTKKHGVEQEIALTALERIYNRLDQGDVWSSGHELDRAILAEAQGLVAAEAIHSIEWIGNKILEIPSMATKYAFISRDAAVADLETVFGELDGMGRLRKVWLALRGKL
jgi:hypothetical protein